MTPPAVIDASAFRPLPRMTGGRAPALPVLIALTALCCAADQPPDLPARIAALPVETTSGHVKKVVLETALRQAQRARPGGNPDRDRLFAEVEQACDAAPASFTAPFDGARHVSALRPLPAPTSNPYLERIVAGAAADLARPLPQDAGARTATFSAARETAWKMESYWWLYTHPASPMNGRADVLGRLLDLSLGYVDAINTAGAGTPHGTTFFDDFAIAPASGVLRELPARHPGLLRPQQQAAWRAAVRLAGETTMRAAAGRKGDYANIDVAIAFTLFNCGLALDDNAMIEKARFLIYAQERNLLEGGGFHYIWNQNESAGYHSTVVDFLARYHEVTGDEKAARLIRASQWHGPGVGRLVDFWTCPSWKQTWNQSSGTPTGGEVVIAMTRNPYVRALVDPDRESRGPWYNLVRSAIWYTPGIEPATWPDNYTFADPDTGGVRSWYGTFNYATTLRAIPETEPGHATLVGAQVTTPDHRLKQALMGVYPRVRIKPQAASGADYTPHAWAWLTSGLRPARIAARHASVTGGTYRLHAFGSSRKGAVSDWTATQLWIGLPDRLVGITQVRPTGKSATAYEVNGVIRFGFGGTALGAKAELKQDGDRRFRFGDMTTILHASTFSSTKLETVPFRRPQAPVSEIVLCDERSPAAGGRIDYPADHPYAFVAEIRAGNGPEAEVARLPAPEGLFALRVQIEGKSHIAWFNAGEAAATIHLQVPAGPCSLWRSETPTGPVSEIPSILTLAPGAALLLICSPQKEDHLPGWSTFESMVRPDASP